jgi:hypothetical protein
MKLEDLKLLRNYFGEHSRTCHEHYLFAIVDKEIERKRSSNSASTKVPELGEMIRAMDADSETLFKYSHYLQGVKDAHKFISRHLRPS